MGVPDPAQMLKEGKLQKRQSRKASVEQLLAMAFPEADVSEVDPNVLKSALFDADTLRLDMTKRTISHTPEFREEFAERYDGRDSECVVRRAARGMWEHVKRHGIPLERGSERSSEYSLLYSVMLSYMAWIFRARRRSSSGWPRSSPKGKEARLAWLQGVRRTGQRIVPTGRRQGRGRAPSARPAKRGSTARAPTRCSRPPSSPIRSVLKSPCHRPEQAVAAASARYVPGRSSASLLPGPAWSSAGAAGHRRPACTSPKHVPPRRERVIELVEAGARDTVDPGLAPGYMTRLEDPVGPEERT